MRSSNNRTTYLAMDFFPMTKKEKKRTIQFKPTLIYFLTVDSIDKFHLLQFKVLTPLNVKAEE